MKFCYIGLLFSFLFFAKTDVFSQSISNDITLELCGFEKIYNQKTVNYQGLDPRTGRIYYVNGQFVIIDGRRPLKQIFHEYEIVKIIFFNGTSADLAFSEPKDYGKYKMNK